MDNAVSATQALAEGLLLVKVTRSQGAPPSVLLQGLSFLTKLMLELETKYSSVLLVH